MPDAPGGQTIKEKLMPGEPPEGVTPTKIPRGQLWVMGASGVSVFASFLFLLTDSGRVPCHPDQVQVGMTEDQLERTCGLPRRRNYSSRSSTQWVYQGKYSLYVYTNAAGKVESKQWSTEP